MKGLWKIKMGRKTNKKMKESLSFTLEGGHIPQRFEGEELQKYLMERSRGCGGHKSKKDYKRREKFQKSYY